MTGPTRLWELRTVEGGANGLEFARSRLDAVHDQVLVHAAPTRMRVEVTDDGAALLAIGEDLRADTDTPMTLLRLDGVRVLREQIWPTDAHLGMAVILPGGEAGLLRSWWNADDERSWRWQIELTGGRG
ncbi:MAG: hypothetical protein E6G58_07730 [Actinobacteria bacterium]|nr:MAG: hypothetical protein E6G58_07730 [Actinomycetota bacterium]